jgi:hypothetical protein
MFDIPCDVRERRIERRLFHSYRYPTEWGRYNMFFIMLLPLIPTANAAETNGLMYR